MHRLGPAWGSLLGLAALAATGCELAAPRTAETVTPSADSASRPAEPSAAAPASATATQAAMAPTAETKASAATTTATASSGALASPTDCALVRTVLDAEPAVRLTGFGPELYETEARLRAAEAAIASTYRSLSPSVLRTPFVDYAHAVAFLKDVVSTRLAVQELGIADLSPIEHAFELGLRSRKLARLAAWARCEPDSSREQSQQWNEEAIERARSLTTSLAGCARPEWERPDGGETAFVLELHIGPDGRVALAGLAPPYCAPRDCPFHLEIVWCAVRRVEALTFPPPSGTAIVQIPLVHAAP